MMVVISFFCFTYFFATPHVGNMNLAQEKKKKIYKINLDKDIDLSCFLSWRNELMFVI